MSIFLVDGYNAIRRVQSLKNAEDKAGLAAGRRALLATIAASRILSTHRVVVVFDAGRESSAPSEPSPHPMLIVRFSTPPRNADAAILALLAGAKKDSAVTVVTADSELAFQARKLGASVVRPESWEPLKAKTAKNVRKQPKAVKDDKPQASAKDVDYWLRVFKDEDSEGD